MAKQMHIITKFIVLIAFVTYPSWAWAAEAEPSTWSKTVAYGRQRKTVLQFYFHDIMTGDNITAVKIAQPEGQEPFPPLFGSLFMADEPLTIGPDPKSLLLGRAQGLYGSASQVDEDPVLIMALSYFFTEGIFNGSSFSILGRNRVRQPVKEMPIVGGTGLFRMARGYAVIQVHYYNTTSLSIILGYNVTIYHSLEF